jgi:lactate permease
MTIAIALTPLVMALFILAILRQSSREAGLAALLVTVLVALFLPPFRVSVFQIVLASGEGAATALTAAVILFPALLFYQVQKATGAIPSLTRGLSLLLPDRDLQILALVLGVGPAVESMCGFGVGAVIIIPLLATVEEDRLKVAGLSLLSQIIVPWAALSIATVLAADLSRLPAGFIGVRTALFLLPTTSGLSLLVLYLSDGMNALARHWFVALVAGSLLMGAACFGSLLVGIETAGVLASLLVVLLFLLWEGSSMQVFRWYFADERRGRRTIAHCLRAFIPYLVLAAGIFSTRLVSLVRTWLQTHGVLVYQAIGLHFALLYSPGVWLLVATLVCAHLHHFHPGHLYRTGEMAWRQFIPVAITLVSFLVMAALMHDSGMTASIAHASAMLGKHYVWIASLVGGACGWLTSSTLGGNALGVPMQMETSTRVGLPLGWMIAMQNASVSIVSMASPARLALVAVTAGAPGKEGVLLQRMAGPVLWSLALITFLLVWFTSASFIAIIALLLAVNAPLTLPFILDRMPIPRE